MQIYLLGYLTGRVSRPAKEAVRNCVDDVLTRPSSPLSFYDTLAQFKGKRVLYIGNEWTYETWLQAQKDAVEVPGVSAERRYLELSDGFEGYLGANNVKLMRFYNQENLLSAVQPDDVVIVDQRYIGRPGKFLKKLKSLSDPELIEPAMSTEQAVSVGV